MELVAEEWRLTKAGQEDATQEEQGREGCILLGHHTGLGVAAADSST
jgi:hypothetical protein